MDNNTAEQKTFIMKILASVGFLAVIIFGVWLAVQIVQYVPLAFTSLASIADSVHNRTEARDPSEFATTASERVLNAGESFEIAWVDMGETANYVFTYTCSDGVALDIRNAAGEIVALSCDTTISLDSNTTLAVTAASERSRFTDIRYTVTAFDANTGDNIATSEGKVTIVNAAIPQSQQIANETTNPSDDDMSDTPNGEVAGETTSEPTPTTPVTTTPRPPVVIEEEIIVIPISNPNGFTDLAVNYLGVGTMSQSGVFTPAITIDNDTRGAFRFEVKNVGTKTSDDWNFSAKLPSGVDYSSKTQTPLKPNERTVITLGFDMRTEVGLKIFSATVKGGDDINLANNAFAWSVTITE